MSVTTEDVKAAVAAQLHLAGPSSLEAWWSDICADALADGLADVRGALAARGFSLDQLAAWPDYDSWVKRQATFWALTRGASLEAFDMKAVEKLDQVSDQKAGLKSVVVTGADGKAVKADVVGRGEFKSDRDVFIDPLTGVFRRW